MQQLGCDQIWSRHLFNAFTFQTLLFVLHILIYENRCGPFFTQLTWNFWMISWVGLCSHSSTLISGCCSRSTALGVLVCLFTLECFGSSSSSKLLNSVILQTHTHTHTYTLTLPTSYSKLGVVSKIFVFILNRFIDLENSSENIRSTKEEEVLTLPHWHARSPAVPPLLQISGSEKKDKKTN